MTTPLENIARKLLRAELNARGARDVDVAEAMISQMLRLDQNTGDYVGVGGLVAMEREGCPPMDLSEVLAEAMRQKPELFGGSSTPPGRVSQPPANVMSEDDKTNPFIQGKSFNITAQMVMMNTEPKRAAALQTRAEHLEYLSGLGRNAS